MNTQQRHIHVNSERHTFNRKSRKLELTMRRVSSVLRASCSSPWLWVLRLVGRATGQIHTVSSRREWKKSPCLSRRPFLFDWGAVTERKRAHGRDNTEPLQVLLLAACEVVSDCCGCLYAGGALGSQFQRLSLDGCNVANTEFQIFLFFFVTTSTEIHFIGHQQNSQNSNQYNC